MANIENVRNSGGARFSDRTQRWPLGLSTPALVLVGLWVVLVGMHFASLSLDGGGWAKRLNADSETGFFTWASIILLASGGALALVTGWQVRRTDAPTGWGWIAAGVILFAMSCEEQVMTHEASIVPLRESLGTSSVFYFAWIIPGLALVALVAVSAVPVLRRLPAQTRWQLVSAGVIFVAGAIGMEMVGGAIMSSTGVWTYTYGAVTGIEEALEMLGVIVAIDAIIRYRHLCGLTISL